MASQQIPLDQLAAQLDRDAEALLHFLDGPAGKATKQKIVLLSVAGAKDFFARSAGPSGAPWAPLKIRSGKPLLDTGRLRNSIQGKVTASCVELSASGVQARLMSEGGTVTPKRGKFLAIPLTP